ncbi:MAG: F0F1 ATP synthase subunit gamma [Maricaulaceae bacterium]
MASLKELKTRIASIKSTQKITKAMQMVAAAKLRKAHEAAENSRPYTERMNAVITNLASSMVGNGDAPEMLVGTGKDDVHLVVVATADRGLCGGFNGNIVRAAREEIIALKRAGKTVKIFCIGKKGHELLVRLYKDDIVEFISLREEKTITAAVAQGLGGKITAMYEAGEFDVAKLIYSQFENVMTQTPTMKTLIPVAAGLELSDEATENSAPSNDLKGAIYTYEPDEAGILQVLMPRNLNTQIFAALLENVAGEMGSKMTAMDNATRNAGDMIDDLSLLFNRTRQAQITSELIEIISGAEAL